VLTVTGPTCDAVLLAAGAGRRLGTPKAFLELHGRWTLPPLVAALLGGGARRVAVVLPPGGRDAVVERGLAETEGLVLVENPAPERGRTGSLHLGLEALAARDAVLVHPADVPLLSARVVARLLGAWAAAPDRDRLVARPVTPTRRGGHPLLVGAARLGEVRALASDAPLRAVLEPAEQRLDVVLRGEAGPFLDVDTPEQLALLEGLLGGQGSASQR